MSVQIMHNLWMCMSHLKLSVHIFSAFTVCTVIFIFFKYGLHSKNWSPHCHDVRFTFVGRTTAVCSCYLRVFLVQYIETLKRPIRWQYRQCFRSPVLNFNLITIVIIYAWFSLSLGKRFLLNKAPFTGKLILPDRLLIVYFPRTLESVLIAFDSGGCPLVALAEAS